MSINIPMRIALGLSCMMQGAAGFERYMLQGETASAIFDAVLHISGVVLFMWGAIPAWRKIEGVEG